MTEILLTLRKDTGYDRQVMRGVIAAARERAGWHVRIVDPESHPEDVLPAWRPTGVVGRLSDPKLVSALADTRIPAVLTSHTESDLPRVGLDEAAIGRMAAAELRGMGFEHFAYVSYGRGPIGVARGEAFTAALGRPCPQTCAEQDEAAGAAWVAGLPTPVAVFSSNDLAGAAALEWALAAGRSVPDEFAVLGVDDDELVCETAAVPLSSIAVPARRIGELAVEMLEELLAQGEAEPALRLLAPVGVVHRRSTQVRLAGDDEVAAALRFIRDHVDRPISVADVLDEVGVSRRKLEVKFKNLLGRTPLAEIQRVRVDRVKRLLTGTSMPLEELAEACGLNSRAQLNRVFKAATGHTPAAYRQTYRR